MFYDVYAKLCAEKGISPTRAAEEIGISRATPTTWKKRGLTPQGETLNKIANYFDVTIDYLIGVADFDTASTMLENKINSSTATENAWTNCLRDIEALKRALEKGVRGTHTLYQIEATIDRAIDLQGNVAPSDKRHFLAILADVEKNLLANDIHSLQKKIHDAKGKLL